MNPWAVVLLLGQREWLRIGRQPVRIVATIGTPLILLVGLASGFSETLSSVSDAGYAGFLVPGALAMAALFAGVFGAMSLITDRDSGLLLSVLAGPTPSWAIGLGKLSGVASLAFVQTLLLVPVAYLVGLRPGVVDLAAVLGSLACLCVGAVGWAMALAWRSRDTQDYHAVMNLVLLPAWMLSGSIYPAEGAAPLIQWATAANPLSWPVASIRGALTGETSLPGEPWIWGVAQIGFAASGIAAMAVMVRRGRWIDA